MDDLGVFYSNLATVAIIAVLGFFLGKAKWISEATNRQLINILLMVAMPCALFGAFPQEFDQSMLDNFLKGMLGGVLVLTAMIIVSKVLFTKKSTRGEMMYESQFALIFNNAAFLGYPLVMTIFGRSAVMPYCGFIIVFNIALFSYGVYLFERKVTKKLVMDIVLNPNIIAVLLGMILFLSSMKLPGFVNSSIGYVGGIMTPLSLICIGYMLSRADFKKMWRKRQLFFAAAAQLVLGPVVTWAIVSLAGFLPEVRHVLILIQALPTATSLGLFAEKYGGNPIEASELVAVSTLMSVVTLPIMLTLLLG